jgi:hypothetical protein
MSERHDPHAGESMAGPHGSAEDHGDAHGPDDHAHGGEAHGGEALGPVDVPMWGAAALGIALGLVVMLAFVQAAA